MSSATRFAAVVSLVGRIMAARPAPPARAVGAATLTCFTDPAAFPASAPTLAVRDAFVIAFPGGNIAAVGADLVTYFRNGTCTIEVSGAKGVIGSTTAPCTSLGSFWGVKADEPITRLKITVPGNNVVGVDNLAFGTGAPPTIHVALDVKPGSDPSPINPRSQGVTPVAVLSSADFDASQ